ncbi:MAG: ATP-binding protein [Chloroflexota bacterium]
MSIAIYLLGQPFLLFDGQPFRFAAPPKTFPLLAYLLLHRQQAISRQQIAFVLWPDDNEADARAKLRRHLHQLQRALPPATPERPWLLLDAASVRWNPSTDFWLDVAAFEVLSAKAETWADAVQLYRGDLLENAYDDWVFFERERLREAYFTCLRQLVLQHRAQRSYPTAIAFAQKILAHDSCREDALRQLVSLRYEAGDRAGAIQEYEVFMHRLQQEMGLTPMPETQALYELVLQNARLPGAEVSQELSATSISETSTAPPSFLPFVGRDSELAQLSAWWDRAARGHGGLALVGGEAGIGKTRLLRELGLLAEQQGGRVLYGSTPSYELRPYQAMIDALQSALPLLLDLRYVSTSLAALAGLLPELHTRCTLPSLPALEPEKERVRLFDAVATILEKLAVPRPLLLVVEDLHWAGESTLALIEFIVRRAVHQPLLVVASYREEEVPRSHPLRAMRRRLQAEKLVEHQALRRLNRRAVENLFVQLSAANLPSGVTHLDAAARLHNASEGNPLFLNLLLQDWQKTGRFDEAALPQSIQAAISLRLAQLSPFARSYAEIAAVLGTTFDFDASREVGGWRECQALDALSELLDAQLVRDTAASTEYAFIHHLIQSSLYAQIPEAKRRHRHLRAAEVLEQLYPDPRDALAGTLALHYDRGGAAERAIPYYQKAVQKYLAVFAESEALAALNRALFLAEQGPSLKRERLLVDLLLLREAIYHRSGDRVAQQDDLAHLEKLVAALDDPSATCEVWLRAIAYHSILGERQLEAEKIRQLKTWVHPLSDPSWRARAWLAEGNYKALVNAYADAQACLQQALALYQAAGDVGGRITCLCALANIAIEQGCFADVQALLEQAEACSSTCDNPSALVQSLRTASGALFAHQNFGEAKALTHRMLDLCRTVGDRNGEADALALLAAVSARTFNVTQAGEYYIQAEQLYHAIGKRQGQAAVMVNRCLLLVGRLGLYEDGLDLIRRAAKMFRLLEDVRGQTVCAVNEGLIALYLGQYESAYTASRRGLELARQMNSRVMEANALANLGSAERELGRLDDAIVHMEAGLNTRRELGQPADLGTDLCDLTVTYCRKGDTTAMQRSCAEMLALYEQAQDAMMHPQYILWAAAQVYSHTGEKARAGEFLAQAYAVLQQKSADMAANSPVAENNYLRLPFNRQIIAAYERNEWPKYT